MSGPHPLVALARAFVVEWLECADDVACRTRVMAPDYRATVGGVTLAGLDEAYLPATLGQLRRFPGLLVTVHDCFTDGQHLALRFTEHGAAADRDGGAAAWGGIGLFGWDGDRLTWNVTEEDYLARRRQLAAGAPDPVATPATAPWSAGPEPPDPDLEAAVRQWLDDGDIAAGGRVLLDDGWTGQPTPPLLAVTGIEVDTLFVAGQRAAFHLTQRGTYLGGIPLPDQPLGAPAELRCSGMVSLDAAGGLHGHVIRDRVGLRRELLDDG